MATEKGDACCSEKKRNGKNLKNYQMLLVDDKVEVRSVEEGYKGSWHPGTIISCEDQALRVQYEHRLDTDGSNKPIKSIKIPPKIEKFIRPLPPPLNTNDNNLHYGQCVDAFRDDAWWEGVIFDDKNCSKKRLIFFPDMGNEMQIMSSNLRLTQDWNDLSGHWKPRKNWFFLELIEEFKKEWPLLISVNQIWSEVKNKEGNRKKLKRWTSIKYGLWRSLVWEVFFDNFKINLKHFLDETNLLGDEADKSPLLFSETSFIEYIDTNSESKIEELSCNGSKVLPKKRNKRKHMWEPAGPHLVPEPEFCPDVIREFIKKSKTQKKQKNNLVLRVRRHLLFMGWKIDFMRFDGSPRMRYISPEGKSYNSLLKAVNNLSEATDNISVPCQNKENILPVLSKKSNEPRENVDDCVESDYCPEAIEQYYYLISTVKRNNYTKFFEDPINNEVRMKAKNHLAALGWLFSYYTRGNGKREPRYISKSGKRYDSLRRACKGCMDEGVVYENNVLTPAVEERKKDIPKIKKRGKKRENSVTALESHLLHKRGKNIEAKDLKKRKKKRLHNCLENTGDDCPKSALRSCKRSRKGVETTLSRLMENNVQSLREKAQYINKNNNFSEGVMRQDFIESNCCQKDFSSSKFELHVRDNDKRREKSDYICSICRYGGELILCDQCPSAFHTKCLGLQCVPDGEWFCPSCCCGICGENRLSNDTKEFGDESILSCDQCEHKYHVGCLRLRDGLKLENSHNENWFCNEKCEKIFLGLQNLLGKPVSVSEENFTWTVIKYSESSENDQNVPDKEALSENYCKYIDALSVMHECFEPSIERKTRRDVLEDVIFSRWSELNRLNFQGFYTVLLEKNEEVITVATVRIHGVKVAEVPLIGTRDQYRRLGMCRMLMNELEKKLKELGVERLVLPAAPSVLSTWTESFGFSKMTELERLNFLNYTFLDFGGTTMCQKFLSEIPSSCVDHLEPEQTTLMLSENNDLDEKSIVSEVVQSDPMFSVQKADLEIPIRESETVFSVNEANSLDKVETAEQKSLDYVCLSFLMF